MKKLGANRHFQASWASQPKGCFLECATPLAVLLHRISDHPVERESIAKCCLIAIKLGKPVNWFVTVGCIDCIVISSGRKVSTSLVENNGSLSLGV